MTTPTDAQPQPTFNLLGLQLPVRSTLAIVVTTVLLVLDYYYQFTSDVFHLLPAPAFPDRVRNSAYDHFFMYLLIPMFMIIVVFRQRPSEYGFRLGDWRTGLKWTLISWAIAAPILYAAGQTPGVQEYYLRYFVNPLDTLFTALVEMIGWEFVFRGFLLWALYEVAGPIAIVLQAVPFAMAHVSKPPIEAVSTIFGGTAFGWVAWRTRSFLYPMLIHLFISTFIVFVAVMM